MTLKHLKLLAFFFLICITLQSFSAPGVTQPAGDISDWERDAAAAGLTDEGRIPGTEQNDRAPSEAGIPIMPPGRAGSPFETDVHTDQVWEDREAIDQQLHDPAADAATQQRFEEEVRFQEHQQQQAADLAAREAAREQTLLDALRATADSSVDTYRQYMEADGKITPEEAEHYDQLTDRQIDLWQMTPAEEAAINAYGDTRQQVAQEIQQAADQLGGTDAASVQAREDNRLMFDAATKTWRKATATGTAVDMVGEDIFHQRELGIAAKNRVLATQAYLQRTDLTPDQRRAAESLLQQHQKSMENAALAISMDLFVITVGTTFDVGTLFLGRAGGALSETLGGGSKAAPGASGASAAGTEAAGASRAAGAGAAGAEASGASRAGASAATEGGETVLDAGRAALRESGETIIEGGTSAGRSGASATSNTGRQLTQAELDELFRPGANLTGEQIIAKAEILIRSNRGAQAEVLNRVGDMVEAGVITEAEAAAMARRVVGAETVIMPPPTAAPAATGAATAARTGPGSTQVLPRTGPGSTQVLPRTGPGSTQVLPRTGPGTTQVLPRTGPGSTQVLPRTGPGSTQVLPAAGGGTQVIPRAAGSASSAGTQAGTAATTAARNKKALKDLGTTAAQVATTEAASQYWEGQAPKKPAPRDPNDWSDATVVGESKSSLAAVTSITGTNLFDPTPIQPGTAPSGPPPTVKPRKPKKPAPAPKPSGTPPAPPPVVAITPPGNPVPMSPPTQPVQPPTTTRTTTTTATTTATTTTTSRPKKCQSARAQNPTISLRHGLNMSGLCFRMQIEWDDSACDGEVVVTHESPGGGTSTNSWKIGSSLSWQNNIYSYGEHRIRLTAGYNQNREPVQLTGQTSFSYKVGPSELNPGSCYIR